MAPGIPPTLPVGPPPSWRQRHPGLFAGVLVGVLALLALGLGGGIVLGVMALLRSSEPCQKGVAAAQANPAVQKALGLPIEQRWFLSGKVKYSGDAGHASLRIPISGPKGRATLQVEAVRGKGIWTYTHLEVQVKGTGETIPLQP